MKKVKELLNKFGDIRILTKENNEVRITDLFLNADDEIRLEQYSTISKMDLDVMAKECNHTKVSSDTLNELLCCIKLWSLNDMENFNSVITDIMSNYDFEHLLALDANDTVIDFINLNLNEMAFIIE